MSQKIAIWAVTFLSFMQCFLAANRGRQEITEERRNNDQNVMFFVYTTKPNGQEFTEPPARIYNTSLDQVEELKKRFEFYNISVAVPNEVFQPNKTRLSVKPSNMDVLRSMVNSTVVQSNKTRPLEPQSNLDEHSTTVKSIVEHKHEDPCEQYDENLSLELSKDVLELAQKILKSSSVGQGSDKETEVISPTCIMGALLLAMLGSNGQTYVDFIGLFSPDVARRLTSSSYDFHKEFSLLLHDATTTEQYSNLIRPSTPWRYTPHRYMNRPLKALNDTTDYKLRIANGIFVDQSFPLREDYKTSVRVGYKTQIKTFDFRRKAEDARKCINKLIRSKTKGKIEQILTGHISAQTNMIIVSSIYFNAKWERPFFEKGATRLLNFYPYGLGNPPIKTMMMATGGLFPYYNDTVEGCQIIGLPYKGNLTTMYVIVPYNSNHERLQQFHNQLTADKIDVLISKMQLRTTTMVFPKMDIKNTLRLRNVFKELGLKNLFDPGQSDLSLITDRGAEVSTMQYDTPDDCVDTDDDGFHEIQENDVSDTETTTLPVDPTESPESLPVDTTLAPRLQTEQQTHTTELPEVTTKTKLPEDPTKLPVLVPREDYIPERMEETTLMPTTTTESTQYTYSQRRTSPNHPTKYKELYQPQPYSDNPVFDSRPLKKNTQDFLFKEKNRSRRHTHICEQQRVLGGFKDLESLRKTGELSNSYNIYADEIVHKIDLTINEQGTEGGAATAATLHRNAPEVPLRVEVPFIFLIRHDPTRLPIFYGLVYKPTYIQSDKLGE